MKWNNYIYIGLLLQLVFAASCYDEKDLVPSEVVSSYSVPQGTHDYDDVIVDIYNQYGSCLLDSLRLDGWSFGRGRKKWLYCNPGRRDLRGGTGGFDSGCVVFIVFG